MPPPLEGLRVVDLTENLAGPFCTMILADMGADVVKIERPGGGDESRRFPPFVNADRVAHRKPLEAELTVTFRRRPAAAWLAEFDRAGIPAGPVNTLDQVFADPQVAARQMVLELEHPTVGRHRVLGIPVKLSATPGAVRTPAPTLGQHTEEVLRELGYPAEEARALRHTGGDAPEEVRR